MKAERNDILVVGNRHYILAKQGAAILKYLMAGGGTPKTYTSLEKRTKIPRPSLYSIVSRLKDSGLVMSHTDRRNVTRVSVHPSIDLPDCKVVSAKVVY